MPPPRFAGIHATLYALFDDAERLDRQAMRRQVEPCIAAGVQGIGAFGLACAAGHAASLGPLSR